jgi:hypothetical protein
MSVEHSQRFSPQILTIWTQPSSAYYITERSCSPNFSPDLHRACSLLFISLFILVVFQASAFVGVPSWLSKGDDRWGFISNRSIIRSPSVSPYRKQTGGMEAYHVRNSVLSSHILSAEALIHGSICASLSPDFVNFHCFLADELVNMCVYRCLETYNWKAVI